LFKYDLDIKICRNKQGIKKKKKIGEIIFDELISRLDTGEIIFDELISRLDTYGIIHKQGGIRK